jgi:hypothetical protein
VFARIAVELPLTKIVYAEEAEAAGLGNQSLPKGQCRLLQPLTHTIPKNGASSKPDRQYRSAGASFEEDARAEARAEIWAIV